MKKPILKTIPSVVLLVSLLFMLTSVLFISASLPDDVQTINDEVANSLNPKRYPLINKGCISTGCHDMIAPIRQHNSKMAESIYSKGAQLGDENGCVVCHAGNPKTKNKDMAHRDLIKFPASMWVNDKTCGQCHEDHIYTMHRNLMQTEAGKIQGALWGWGAQNGYKVVYGNYELKDTDGKTPKIGTEKYKEYMLQLMGHNPDAFPDSLLLLPEVNLKTLEEMPEQAVLTYIRSDCQRCHVGVRGIQRRGDYRGAGCAACHLPFGDEGFYEGKDKSIPADEPGHVLVHTIQSSRKAKVLVNDKVYSGIPAETCVTCHNRGKRIGVSFLGTIESPYDTPWGHDGESQPKLHGKRYQFIRDDHHHNPKNRPENPEGSILCQDCHLTTDVHGNGNIGGATFGEVEIECSDCHGTPEKYPWELPLGWGDEFGVPLSLQQRGLSSHLLSQQEKQGTIYEPKDGYLLSARGNPLGNVVKIDNKAIMHSAGGLDFKIPLLKNLNEQDKWQNPVKATTAMVNVRKHMSNLECYACHSTWAAQCYGCHVKVDYSKNQTSTDWIKTANLHFANGETSETMKGYTYQKQPGKASEGRTYIRWEDPILGINGEGRVGPLIPGCQQITTVIGEDGETIISNKIWRTPAEMENGGAEGQKGIDMSPAHPHTVSRQARECTSCHTDPKALGYGINGGKYMQNYDEDTYIDLRAPDGQNISKNSTPQFAAIPELDMDLSQIVTRAGKQLQTVGHHFQLSGPLSQDQRERMERVGVCIACHQDIPDGNLAIKAIVKAGGILNISPHFDEEHSKLLNSDINLAAWVRVLGPVVLVLLIVGFWFYRRRMKRRIG